MTDPTVDALAAAEYELRSLHDYVHSSAQWDDCEVCGIIRRGFSDAGYVVVRAELREAAEAYRAHATAANGRALDAALDPAP